MARRSSTSSICLVLAGVIALSSFAVDADFDAIAGYTPVSDVVEHSELDLDMAELEAAADLETEAGFVEAWTVYSTGGNSEKTDSIRTIRGFSTSALEKLSGEKWFDIYQGYWREPDYADLFTTAACNGTDAFDGVDTVVRAEGCVKGAQYQNVWMYVIHELEDAIGDCNKGDLTANDGGPHAWDEAWAFYAGSLQEIGGDEGQMIYALADKRCANFGTCTGDDDGSDTSGTSAVNAEIRDLFQEGVGKLQNGDCDEVEGIKDNIVDLMTVPLLQGVLRYLYKADPSAGNEGDKAWAELWAFSAAILPRIHECDVEVAAVIRDNADLASSDAPVSEGYVAMKEKLETVYSCLGISCGQVGGLLMDEGTEYFNDFGPCDDGDGDGVAGWVVAVIVIAVIAVVGAAALLCYKKRTSQKKTAQAMESDLGGFGAKPAGTI